MIDLPNGETYSELTILRPQVVATNFEPDTLEQVVRTMEEELAPAPGSEGGIIALARLVNGTLFNAELVAGQDNTFDHSLARVPQLLVMSWDLDGNDGRVLGTQANGPNTEAWTRNTITVRPTVSGRYLFLVT